MFKKIFLASILACMHIWLASAFEASYYSDAFEGGTSANGTTFSQTNHTAAICYEELSQLAYVSTAQTGMVVTLTDRPNCSRHSDRIDLSSSAFSVFAPLSRWVLQDVSVTPLGIKTGKFVKRNISQKEFSPLSVELTRPIANTYIAGESVSIAGRVTNGKKQVNTYFVNKKTGEKIEEAYLTDGRWYFDLVVTLPTSPWEYFFGLIPPEISFYQTDLSSILIFSSPLITDKVVSWENRSVKKKIKLTPKIRSSQGSIVLPSNTWGTLRIQNQGKTINLSGKILSFGNTGIQEGPALFTFTGYALATPSSLDRSREPTRVATWTVLLDRIRETTGSDKIVTRTTKSITSFRFMIRGSGRVASTYYVTIPSGDVIEYDLPSSYGDGKGFIKTWVWIVGSFPTQESGVYKLEFIRDTGIAYINLPIYQGEAWSIVPVLSDQEIRNIQVPREKVMQSSYTSVNILRTSLNRKPLVRDPDLDILAQKKADYMLQTQDFGHVTQDGRDIHDFAKALRITGYTKIAENIAGWVNTGGIALQDGLEESGSHRHTMISPEYTKIWIGYGVRGEHTYLVQVFSN